MVVQRTSAIGLVEAKSDTALVNDNGGVQERGERGRELGSTESAMRDVRARVGFMCNGTKSERDCAASP